MPTRLIVIFLGTINNRILLQKDEVLTHDLANKSLNYVIRRESQNRSS